MGAPGNTAPPVPKTFTAEGDLVAYRFVKLGTGDQGVVQANAQGEACVGVAVSDVTAAQADAASVWLLGDGGIIPIEASAAIAVGSLITTGADGRAEAALTGDIVLGRLVEAASGAGHVVGFIPEYANRAV